ncbi:glycoside hydrolase family 35 protein [Streptococcus thoraltensis]|uniref:glycoside hydrolase family 35 protein n=1 Tax=Streptococcus thoraltensis TaxID=55085 RepID=UPI001F58C6D1|nr:beta-galactosidase [Streptococcus thoraltensis]
MSKFTIGEDFYLDGRPFKILSGAIHYFRVPKASWYHSLYNLKALGFNTVETYVPWNRHESKEGEYDFSKNLDLDAFLTMAQELGLYAIVRPSPYICAEWEFGGLPAWLIEKQVKVRSDDPKFLAYVERYYKVLLPKLAKHQLEQGGNILMFQVENEYGSYGENKRYLRALKKLMEENGLSAPFFTSDGAWQATMRAGSLIDDDVLVTGNFGSKAKLNFARMRSFFQQHGKKWPLMSMEFWDGWFNRWKEPIIRRDPEELADSVMEVLEEGSINLYMFHGGTNFGFMNGASARRDRDLPQVTSYDYDAILDEAGNPSPKFYALQKRLKVAYPDLDYKEPLVKESMGLADISLKRKVTLKDTLAHLSTSRESFYPQNMEALGQETGYIFYRTRLPRDHEEERLRVIDARDRIHVFLDDQNVATQYQDEIGADIMIKQETSDSRIDILVENMGRVTYGHKLEASTQSKGLGRGLMADLHFVGGWEQYPLPLDNIEKISYEGQWQEGLPSFYEFEFDCQSPKDTYIDLSSFGKGVVFINGYHLGRFWQVGPILSLYLPGVLIKKGRNIITVFETEGIYHNRLSLKNHPIYKEMEGENL